MIVIYCFGSVKLGAANWKNEIENGESKLMIVYATCELFSFLNITC